MDTPVVDPRRERGLELAKSKGKRFRLIVDNKYLVPSATEHSAGYVVDIQAGECSCPDHEERSVRCKHLWAVEFFRSEVTVADGSTDVIESARIISQTSARSSRAYNLAQTHEKEHVLELLFDLCRGIEEPPRDSNMGRPRVPLRDAIFASAMKVYGATSARRADTDIRRYSADGYMDHAPAFSSVVRTMLREDVTPILRRLIQESAMPLRAMERLFAIDSTGLGVNAHTRWRDEKYPKGRKPKGENKPGGRERSVKDWIKLHAIVGTATNVFVAVDITESYGVGAGDSPHLVPLLQRVVDAGFKVDSLAGDKAYFSNENLAAIEAAGGIPFVMPKINSTGKGSKAMTRLWHMYSSEPEEFLRRYHRRSKVESDFSALKRIFGGWVRNRRPVSQVNEALLKVLVYNLKDVIKKDRERASNWREVHVASGGAGEEPDSEAPSGIPGDRTPSSEKRMTDEKRVETILKDLDPDARRVLDVEAQSEEELAPKDIADKLGWTVGQVHRARERVFYRRDVMLAQEAKRAASKRGGPS